MTFSNQELADPLRSVKRLMLAAQDMGEAADAAARLRDEPGSRLFETALAISYARPWTLHSIGKLEEHWLPTDRHDVHLHEELLRLRDKLYAHTDDEFGARGIHEVSGYVGGTDLVLVSGWRVLRAELVPAYEDIAVAQRRRFRAGANEFTLKLRRFGVEVRWPRAIPRDVRRLLLDELGSELFALRPTGAGAINTGFAVEIELTDPRPGDEEFPYGVQRLLRALRQWSRRLISEVSAYVTAGPHQFAIPLGRAGDADPNPLNHERLLAAVRQHQHQPGLYRWTNGWHRE